MTANRLTLSCALALLACSTGVSSEFRAAPDTASASTKQVRSGYNGRGRGDGDATATGNAGTGRTLGADAPGARLVYAEDSSIFANPERGFYHYVSITGAHSLDYVREDGKTLVYTNIELQDYLGKNHAQPLPQSALDAVQRGFDTVRDARLKAIVRFRYDGGAGYPGGTNDAPEAWILRHIAQLAPLLAANEDVIYLLQAGFIGAWGEWHTSNNFVDGAGDAEARARIVKALLAALPTSRRTAVRYPAYKRMFYGNAPTTAFDLVSGTAAARVGHLNDCFVSGPADVGTYQYEPQNLLQDYLARDTALVPNGGETCAVDARNACSTTLQEMERFHFSYINDDYHPAVLQTWSDEGCRPEIERRLGYRLSLVESELPRAVRPGGSFTLRVELKNEGFAAPTNPRPVFLVLEQAGRRELVKLNQDPRLWTPGPVSIEARIRVPSAAAAGTFRVALWLPDEAEGLRDSADYAIRLAAQDVWEAASGDNTLGSLNVTPEAAGEVVDGAQHWSLITER